MYIGGTYLDHRSSRLLLLIPILAQAEPRDKAFWLLTIDIMEYIFPEKRIYQFIEALASVYCGFYIWNLKMSDFINNYP